MQLEKTSRRTASGRSSATRIYTRTVNERTLRRISDGSKKHPKRDNDPIKSNAISFPVIQAEAVYGKQSLFYDNRLTADIAIGLIKKAYPKFLALPGFVDIDWKGTETPYEILFRLIAKVKEQYNCDLMVVAPGEHDNQLSPVSLNCYHEIGIMDMFQQISLCFLPIMEKDDPKLFEIFLNIFRILSKKYQFILGNHKSESHFDYERESIEENIKECPENAEELKAELDYLNFLEGDEVKYWSKRINENPRPNHEIKKMLRAYKTPDEQINLFLKEAERFLTIPDINFNQLLWQEKSDSDCQHDFTDYFGFQWNVNDRISDSLLQSTYENMMESGIQFPYVKKNVSTDKTWFESGYKGQIGNVSKMVSAINETLNKITT